ncbi:hypothetical protein [Dankookia sp. P2]|uniref:hypothetical protein n=1 Tax=Dankookia sp. P2 TaxID=3423955 RepID=UPI003D67DCD4
MRRCGSPASGDFSRIFIDDAKTATPLAYAVQGFFLNGGSACYVVNLGKDMPISGNGSGLDRLEIHR